MPQSPHAAAKHSLPQLPLHVHAVAHAAECGERAVHLSAQTPWEPPRNNRQDEEGTNARETRFKERCGPPDHHVPFSGVV
jgi:hypothetical protein